MICRGRLFLPFLILAAALPSRAAGDFAISAAPSSRTVIQGQGTSYTVTITPSGGFKDYVTVTVSGLPDGAQANPVSVPPKTPWPVTVTTSTSTPPGTYLLTFTGASGALSHSTTATLIVDPIPPDFSLTATPSSRDVTQGESTSYSISVVPTGGFSGVVSFAVSGLPAGASGTFDPATVTGSGSTAMSVATQASTPAGEWTLTITGTSGGLQRTAVVTLRISQVGADFSLSAAPPFDYLVSGYFGSLGDFTITISPVNGFYGTVNFSVSGLPSNTTASFSPPSVSGSGSASLYIRESGGPAPDGTYPLTITGTSGSLIHTATVELIVTPCFPSLSIPLISPSTATVVRAAGTDYSVVVLTDCEWRGDLTMSVTGLPAGATASFTPQTFRLEGHSSVTSRMTVVTSAGTPVGTSSLTVRATSPDDYATRSASLAVVSPTDKFALSSPTPSQSTEQGMSADYTITVTPGKGFSGDVQFSVQGLPYMSTATFNPATVSGSGSTTMTVTTNSAYAPLGSHTLWVTGTSGDLRNFISVQLIVIERTYSLSGKVMESDGVTPISGATVEAYRGALKGSATTDSQGNYQILNMPEGDCNGTCGHAVICSAAGHKTDIRSAVQIPVAGIATQDFSLPVHVPTAPGAKEYIYAGDRLLAIDESAEEGVDFEQYVGWNDASVGIPPRAVGIATFSGGQICPVTANLPADETTVYLSNDPVIAWCAGCVGTITVDFAVPVSNLSLLLLNGWGETGFTVRDDRGGEAVLTLPGNHAWGAATIYMPSAGIRQLTVTSDRGSFNWDFSIDNLAFTVDAGGQSAPAGVTRKEARVEIHSAPRKPADVGVEAPAAAARKQ